MTCQLIIQPPKRRVAKTTVSPDYDQIPAINDRIKCPKCGLIQVASILQTWPWATYVHYCNNCQHVITQSDWKSVK